MKFWIDIESATGIKQGAGPVQTAVTWQQTARLSRAGSFDFSMPAVDDRAAAITSKRHVRCWGHAPALTQIGRGIIDNIKTSIPPSGEIMLDVSGDDLLRELTWRTVGQLKVEQLSTGIAPLTAIKHEPAFKNNYNLIGAPISINATSYIYVRGTDMFSAWKPTISIGNTNTSILSAQFYSENEEWSGWETIAITDGTRPLSATLARSGTISWALPETWAQTSHNGERGYWMRFKVSANTSAITFTANTITAPGETQNGPQMIMAFAPAGWSLDTSIGHSATAKSVKWQFDGETVLAALIKLSELTGENFRLGSGRSLVWLQTDTPASNLRAVRHTAAYEMSSNDSVCLIVDFEEVAQSHDSHIGRIYPIGQNDLSLMETTRSAPSGYVLGNDTLGYYLENTSAVAAYGIHTWLKVPGAKTPDELYDAAYEELKKRKDADRSYRMTVTKLMKPLYVGDSIHVEYRRIIGGFVAYDVNDDFTVLEITDRIDQNGRRSVGLIIASAARWPQTDAEELAKLL